MKNFDPEIQKITDYCFSEKRFSDDVLNLRHAVPEKPTLPSTY